MHPYIICNKNTGSNISRVKAQQILPRFNRQREKSKREGNGGEEGNYTST